MNFRFEQALDACLAQLNTGADLEAVLGGFPEHADELRPALAASEYVQRLAPPPERRLASKGAFVAAVAERRRLVEHVDGLVVEVKVGVPVAEILSRTAAPLQAVVCAAHAMQVDVDAAPMPSSDAFARGKAELMARAAQRRAASRSHVASAAPSRAFGGFSWPSLLRRAASSAVALSVAATIGATGLVQVSRAAASSLPGDTLYQVKLIGQGARMLFTFDPAARSALQAELAQRRVADIERLVASGRSVPAEAIERLLAEKASIDGLSAVQRAMLGGLVRTMARADAGLAERLRGAANDPSIVDALLRDGASEESAVPLRKPAPVALPAEDRAPVVEVAPAAPKADDRAAAPQPASTANTAPAGPGLTAGGTDQGAPGPGQSADTSGGDDPTTSGGPDEPEAGPNGSGAQPSPDEPEPPAPPQMQPNVEPEPEEPAAAPVTP